MSKEDWLDLIETLEENEMYIEARVIKEYCLPPTAEEVCEGCGLLQSDCFCEGIKEIKKRNKTYKSGEPMTPNLELVFNKKERYKILKRLNIIDGAVFGFYLENETYVYDEKRNNHVVVRQLIEDDGTYFMTDVEFDAFWVDDLIKTAKKLKKELKKSKWKTK